MSVLWRRMPVCTGSFARTGQPRWSTARSPSFSFQARNFRSAGVSLAGGAAVVFDTEQLGFAEWLRPGLKESAVVERMRRKLAGALALGAVVLSAAGQGSAGAQTAPATASPGSTTASAATEGRAPAPANAQAILRGQIRAGSVSLPGVAVTATNP